MHAVLAPQCSFKIRKHKGNKIHLWRHMVMKSIILYSIVWGSNDKRAHSGNAAKVILEKMHWKLELALVIRVSLLDSLCLQPRINSACYPKILHRSLDGSDRLQSISNWTYYHYEGFFISWNFTMLYNVLCIIRKSYLEGHLNIIHE